MQEATQCAVFPTVLLFNTVRILLPVRFSKEATFKKGFACIRALLSQTQQVNNKNTV